MGEQKSENEQSENEEKSKTTRSWQEAVIKENDAFFRFLVLLLVCALLSCGLGATFQYIFRLERANKVEFSKSSFAITYHEGEASTTFALIHANQMLPQDGIPIRSEEPVKVSANGTICTGFGSELKSLKWDGSGTKPMKELVLSKYRLGEICPAGIDGDPPDDQALRKAKDTYPYYAIGLDSLVRQHEMDLNLQWRYPDGKLVCGVKEPEISDDVISRTCKLATILPQKPWGFLLGTVAENRDEAYSNILEQKNLDRQSSSNVHDKNGNPTNLVFPVGQDLTFFLQSGFVYQGKSNKGTVMARYQATNPKLFLFVNDVILDKVLIKDLIGLCYEEIKKAEDAKNEEAAEKLKVKKAEYKWHLDLLDIPVTHHGVQEAFSDECMNKWKQSLSGLWFLNNLGVVAIVLEGGKQ